MAGLLEAHDFDSSPIFHDSGYQHSGGVGAGPAVHGAMESGYNGGGDSGPVLGPVPEPMVGPRVDPMAPDAEAQAARYDAWTAPRRAQENAEWQARQPKLGRDLPPPAPSVPGSPSGTGKPENDAPYAAYPNSLPVGQSMSKPTYIPGSVNNPAPDNGVREELPAGVAGPTQTTQQSNMAASKAGMSKHFPDIATGGAPLAPGTPHVEHNIDRPNSVLFPQPQLPRPTGVHGGMSEVIGPYGEKSGPFPAEAGDVSPNIAYKGSGNPVPTTHLTDDAGRGALSGALDEYNKSVSTAKDLGFLYPIKGGDDLEQGVIDDIKSNIDEKSHPAGPGTGTGSYAKPVTRKK